MILLDVMRIELCHVMRKVEINNKSVSKIINLKNS